MLFQRDAKSIFTEVTSRRYGAMKARLEKKGLPPVPFSLETFRDWTYRQLGFAHDGVIRCPYCQVINILQDCAVDHKRPLSKGGSEGLDNLEWICTACNDAKGSILPEDYRKLLRFLEDEIPMARIDILDRLRKAVSLVSSVRRNAVVIRDLKESGEWKKSRDKFKKPKDDGLGPF